ncbi:MAG: carboxypeptidase-like regulatory domain-containing protein [Bacteroidota bacterium]|nr:carboxypeptidase-like regulatory domain-containing protein [Bacteroidota bacterium]
MRKFIPLLFFLNFCLVSYNQVIVGTILDKNTKTPIDFANVYFNGTFIRTASDRNGNFRLDISKNPAMPVTVSAMGYYSITLTDFSAGDPILVYMIPKVYKLKEVVVNAKSLARKKKRYMVIFKNAFLGLTENAKNCSIANENDITFNYFSKKDTLKAFASKPILIDNRALGYKISFYLDKFEYNWRDDSFCFSGDIIFKEDSTLEESKKQVFREKRREAYFGSRMHFFRALWNNELEAEGFKITTLTGKKLYYKDLVFQKDSLKKFLKYPKKLCLHYLETDAVSYLYFNKKEVYFEKNGYFDPLAIEWVGPIIDQRIADSLPYEFGL